MLKEINLLKCQLQELWDGQDALSHIASGVEAKLCKLITLQLRDAKVLRRIQWKIGTHRSCVVSSKLSESQLRLIRNIIGDHEGIFGENFEHGSLILPNGTELEIQLKHDADDEIQIYSVGNQDIAKETIEFFGLESTIVIDDIKKLILRHRNDIERLEQQLEGYESKQ